jgi:hypothetical protein
MSRTLSADETRQEYITAMGQDLGSVFYRLYHELTLLHIRWREYTELFGTKPERVDLLNRAAGWFFRLVQATMEDYIVLSLSRITDKPKVAGKDTLTVQRLPKLVSDPGLAAEVQALVDVALVKTKSARDRRNRSIAHIDLLLALGQGAQPLEAASLQSVREALEAIAAVLNRLQVAYLATEPIPFDMTAGGLGDALSLLHVIRDGLEADEARHQRLKERRPLDGDLGPPRAL